MACLAGSVRLHVCSSAAALRGARDLSPPACVSMPTRGYPAPSSLPKGFSPREGAQGPHLTQAGVTHGWRGTGDGWGGDAFPLDLTAKPPWKWLPQGRGGPTGGLEMVVSHHGVMGHSQCWWHWVSIARVLPGKGRARASTLLGAALCHKRKLVAPQVPGQGHTWDVQGPHRCRRVVQLHPAGPAQGESGDGGDRVAPTTQAHHAPALLTFVPLPAFRLQLPAQGTVVPPPSILPRLCSCPSFESLLLRLMLGGHQHPSHPSLLPATKMSPCSPGALGPSAPAALPPPPIPCPSVSHVSISLGAQSCMRHLPLPWPLCNWCCSLTQDQGSCLAR